MDILTILLNIFLRNRPSSSIWTAMGGDLVLGEIAHHIADHLLLFGEFKVHLWTSLV